MKFQFFIKKLLKFFKLNNKIFDSELCKLKENNLLENEKTFLDILLVQYQEIRTELREVISRQNSVLISSIVQFGTLFTRYR